MFKNVAKIATSSPRHSPSKSLRDAEEKYQNILKPWLGALTHSLQSHSGSSTVHKPFFRSKVKPLFCSVSCNLTDTSRRTALPSSQHDPVIPSIAAPLLGHLQIPMTWEDLGFSWQRDLCLSLERTCSQMATTPFSRHPTCPAGLVLVDPNVLGPTHPPFTMSCVG